MATKSAIIAKAVKAARSYELYLRGRSLLFIGVHGADVKVLEVSFFKGNFQHLTGIRSPGITPSDFYDRCLEGRVSASDISDDRNGLAALKLSVSPTIFSADLGAKMFGEGNGSRIYLSSSDFVGGVSCALGVVSDRNHGRVPNTVLKSDIRKEVVVPYRVVAVFGKRIESRQFDEVVRRPSDGDRALIADRMESEYGYLLDLV